MQYNVSLQMHTKESILPAPVDQNGGVGAYDSLAFESSDPTVATVQDQENNVTHQHAYTLLAFKPGTCAITATATQAGVTFQETINVTVTAVPLQTLGLTFGSPVAF